MRRSRVFALVFILVLLFSYNITAQVALEVPKLLGVEWGHNLNSCKNKLRQVVTGLTEFRFYPIRDGSTESNELRNGSNLKYIADGVPFFNIPAEIILTFYNSNGTIAGLQLSKIELYLMGKDTNNAAIDSRSVFRDLVRLFCEKYGIRLTPDLERNIFTNYNYTVTVEGISVNFLVNTAINRSDNRRSLFISYQNEPIQNQILRKEIEIQRRDNNTQPEETSPNDVNIRSIL